MVGPVAVAVLGPLVWAGSAGWAGHEVIGLKDGHQVTGEVVAEKASALYVDLGFDILRIPRDQIVQRGKPGEGRPGGRPPSRARRCRPVRVLRPPAAQVGPGQGAGPPFGEAVISIETPSGKGSGFIINDDGYAITNDHVIQGETRIAAMLYQNVPGGLARRRIENVEIVALNPFFDLACLKLPPQKDLKYSHVVLGSLDDVNAGMGSSRSAIRWGWSGASRRGS